METRGYDNLSVKEKENLNSIFREIATKVGIDFNNPEFQDIRSALSEMMERIKTRINERGVFHISRLEPCGSMAEKTAMWKARLKKQTYIEFDFLAVLQATCDLKPGCQECFYVNTPPMNLDLFEKYNSSLYSSHIKTRLYRNYKLGACFTRETINCLASCGCQDVEYPDQDYWEQYTFKPPSTYSETQQGCDTCNVNRPTGTLRVLTSEKMGQTCTLMFQWTSKAKTLCSRDSVCLPKTEKMDNLTIDVDFLPALELFQSKQQSADVAACSSSGLVLNPTSSEYEHYCFLVRKKCHVSDEFGFKGAWRRSCCRAEIDTFVNKMSDKHRNCYQVLKHLTGLARILFNIYHRKIADLQHNSSSSDAGENCVEYVSEVLDEPLHAFETEQPKSFCSQANLFELVERSYCYRRSFINEGNIYSAVLESVMDIIVNKLSDSYRESVRLLKHLARFPFDSNILNNYHLKIAVLHHISSCSDAGEDCVECVFKVLDELQHAYKTKRLKSLYSQANLLELADRDDCDCGSDFVSALKRTICSSVFESDSISSSLKKIASLYLDNK